MDLRSLYPDDPLPLFRMVYGALEHADQAVSGTAHLEQLIHPIHASVQRMKQGGLGAEANRLKHEFRLLLHALHRLETHLTGIMEGRDPLMGQDEALIYAFFAEQRYDALLAYVADLDARRLH